MSLPEFLSIPDLVLRWQQYSVTPAVIWECLKTDKLHIDFLPDDSKVYKQGEKGDFFFMYKPEALSITNFKTEKITDKVNLLEVWVRTCTPQRIKAVGVSESDIYECKSFSSFINIAAVTRCEADPIFPNFKTYADASVTKTERKKKERESQEHLVKLLKGKLWDDYDIAQELINIYPSIVPSRIGRLLTYDSINRSDEAYRKKGERLLKHKS